MHSRPLQVKSAQSLSGMSLGKMSGLGVQFSQRAILANNVDVVEICGENRKMIVDPFEEGVNMPVK